MPTVGISETMCVQGEFLAYSISFNVGSQVGRRLIRDIGVVPTRSAVAG